MTELLTQNPWLTASLPYWTAFLVGLLGSVHCLGMCGPVLAVFALGLPEQDRAVRSRLVARTLAYNLGRLTTYAGLGVAIGWIGLAMGEGLAQYSSWVWLRYAAGLMMVAMGLYLSGWWFGLLRIERLGSVLWRWIQPLSKRLLPVKSSGGAYAYGLVWGLLPCGLVYTLLVWSLAAGGVWQAAGFMLAFGLGTLPAVAGAGLAAAKGFQVGIGWRRAAGVMVMAFGVWTLLVTYWLKPSVGLGCLVS